MTKRKLLAVFISAVIILSAIPLATVSAAAGVNDLDGERTVFLGTFGKVSYNGKSYESFKTFSDALNALGSEGGRIVLSGNISVGEFKSWNGIFKDIWKDIVCYYPLADDDTDQIKIIKSTSNNISKTDDGYLFNGSNSYINLGRQMFESFNNQITLAGWIKPNSLTKDQRLISKTEGGDWQIGINESDFPNYVCGYLRLNGTYYNPKFNVNDLNVNEWNHLALTYDGSSIKLYHNFVIKDTIIQSGTISHSSAPCMIGAEPNNNGYAGSTFDGLIKKVGVWSRGLTEEEIKKLQFNF